MLQRREQVSERFRERMDRMQERMHEMREKRERLHTLDREVAEALKSGNPHPEELKKKLEELRSLREDRRHEQRAFLHRRWGRDAFKPEAKDELERHARRLARLQRLEVIAATERTGDARKRLIARIEQLRALEEKRHEEAMKKLVPDAPPAAAASAELGSPSAAPAAPPTPSAGDAK
jgi:myosin heavy subunit